MSYEKITITSSLLDRDCLHFDDYSCYIYVFGYYDSPSKINDFFRLNLHDIGNKIGSNSMIYSLDNYACNRLIRNLNLLKFYNESCNIVDYIINNGASLIISNKDLLNFKIPIPEVEYEGYLCDELWLYHLNLLEEYEDELSKSKNECEKKVQRFSDDLIVNYFPFELLDKTYDNRRELMIDLCSYVKQQNHDLLTKTNETIIMLREPKQKNLNFSFGINIGFFSFSINLK